VARTLTTFALILAAGALAVAGCGADEGGTATNQPPAQGTGTAEGAAVTQEAGQGAQQGGRPAEGGQVDVVMRDIAYLPATVKARVGERIVWTNEDNVEHTVTKSGEGTGPSSPTIAPGGTFEFVPAQKGRIPYFCEVHPNQEGTIVVS